MIRYPEAGQLWRDKLNNTWFTVVSVGRGTAIVWYFGESRMGRVPTKDFTMKTKQYEWLED